MFKKILSDMLTDNLHRAAQAGDAAKVRKLIARGLDVNGRDKHHATPLFWAAFSQDTDVAEALVEHGADVNAVNLEGATPLYNALHKANEPLALWLLDRGADPRAMDVNGNTMLHLACIHELLPVVERLLAGGAEVNALNSNGQSPLTLQVLMQLRRSPEDFSTDCIFLLLEAGAQYTPIPRLELPLADILSTHADPRILRGDLQAFMERTRNEALRDFAANMQARLGSPFVTRKKTGEESVESSVLGTLNRGEFDFWESQPVAVPFYYGEKITITYDFDPDDDPAFLQEADQAAAAFLKLDDSFRQSFSRDVAEFAKINLEAWDYSGYEAEYEEKWVGLRDPDIDENWLNAFVAGEKASEDVWRMVGDPVGLHVRRKSDDGVVYAAMQWQCLWDSEHQFQLSFREGRELVRISSADGNLTD